MKERLEFYGNGPSLTAIAMMVAVSVMATLGTHPIAMLLVVVIGLSDPEWGRRVHAIVQPITGTEPSADELRSYASERLARYKVPKTIEFIDAIPRTEATKLNRAALIAERESDDRAPNPTGTR